MLDGKTDRQSNYKSPTNTLMTVKRANRAGLYALEEILNDTAWAHFDDLGGLASGRGLRRWWWWGGWSGGRYSRRRGGDSR